MKVLILADPTSSHTQKWVLGLAEKNVQIYITGFSSKPVSFYDTIENVELKLLNLKEGLAEQDSNSLGKLGYLKAFKQLKSIIKHFQPDILHAHYASSYGLLGALLNFKPYIISVWGSDVYDFPRLSFLHKKILQFNFSRAQQLLSTSRVMGEEIQKYTNRPVDFTPFGIDTHKFYPKVVEQKSSFVFGTVKKMTYLYGIDLLLQAFHRLIQKYPERDIVLTLIGDGRDKDKFEALSKSLTLGRKCIFKGYIPNDQLVEEYAQMDIVVIPSLQESFGVSVLEAFACKKTVIASNVDGFKEVGRGDACCFFSSGDIESLCDTMEALMLSSEQQSFYAERGYNRVLEEYTWEQSLDKMLNVYQQMMA